MKVQCTFAPSTRCFFGRVTKYELNAHDARDRMTVEDALIRLQLLVIFPNIGGRNAASFFRNSLEAGEILVQLNGCTVARPLHRRVTFDEGDELHISRAIVEETVTEIGAGEDIEDDGDIFEEEVEEIEPAELLRRYPAPPSDDDDDEEHDEEHDEEGSEWEEGPEEDEEDEESEVEEEETDDIMTPD